MNKQAKDMVRCVTCRGSHPDDGAYVGRNPVVTVDGFDYQLHITPPYGNTWSLVRPDGSITYVTHFGRGSYSIATFTCMVAAELRVNYAPMTELHAGMAARRLSGKAAG